MQLTEVFYYAVLAITFTATCVEAEIQKQDVEERSLDRRANRREVTVLIDNFPMETIYHKPKVIYRRISRHKYRVPKPKPRYGPPRPKYGLPKSSRKPIKKYRGKIGSPKYGPPNHKIRPFKPKPQYGPPKRPNKPIYGPPKKTPIYMSFPPESSGFGEPPTDFENDFLQAPKNKHGDPPVDSYGAPIKSTLSDIVPTSQSFADPNNFDSSFGKFDQEYQSWKSFQRDQNIDSSFAFSKKHPSFVKLESDVFVTPATPDSNEDNLKSYSDIYSYRQSMKEKILKDKKKKPQYFMDNAKIISKLKKAPKKPEPDDEIIVGGQYAEPPARYMAKFQPTAAMFSDDENDDPSVLSFVDSEVAASPTSSPYENYKNSNVAFNPQNLNDAFTIPE